ncbi:MAG: hypothetical protein MZV70_40835 [Desulfobacterales bacterium]|nr:hypothetical protein [Desulfobacterales bacterium]
MKARTVVLEDQARRLQALHPPHDVYAARRNLQRSSTEQALRLLEEYRHDPENPPDRAGSHRVCAGGRAPAAGAVRAEKSAPGKAGRKWTGRWRPSRANSESRSSRERRSRRIELPEQSVAKQASGRQPRRAAFWKAQHIHPYVSIYESGTTPDHGLRRCFSTL